MGSFVLVFFLFISLPFPLFSDQGMTGGVKFSQKDTITATTTYGVEGGSEEGPGILWFRAGTDISLQMLGTGASVTLVINSTAGAASSLATQTMPFPILSPTANGADGAVSNDYQAVYLASSTLEGVDFGNSPIPLKWNTDNPFQIILPVFTPDLPGASAAVLQLRAQRIGSGTPKWTVGSYTIIATETVTLLATTSVQTVIMDDFKISNAFSSPGDLLYLQIFRVGANTADTHDDALYFYPAYGEVSTE